MAERLKFVLAASFKVFKKKRSEASPLLNSVQLKVNDFKLSTFNITNTEGESGIWFSERPNETDWDVEKKKKKNHGVNLKDDEFRTEKAVSFKVHKGEIK